MTGTQLALGITVAAIITGVTIQAVRAAKKSGAYEVTAGQITDASGLKGWSWTITKSGSSDIIKSMDATPPGIFPSRAAARQAGMQYARTNLGATFEGGG